MHSITDWLRSDHGCLISWLTYVDDWILKTEDE